MKPLEKIDAILNRIYLRESDEPFTVADIRKLIVEEKVFGTDTGNNVRIIEVYEILMKLVFDRFLNEENGNNHIENYEQRKFNTSFEGRLFCENGGYTKERKNNLKDKYFKNSITILTFITAFATLAVGVTQCNLDKINKNKTRITTNTQTQQNKSRN